MDLGIQCALCKATAFRRSRLQLKDWSVLLGLQYPVRCMACSKRQRVALGVARRAVPAFRVDRLSPDEAALVVPSRQSAVAGVGEAPASLPVAFRPLAMPDLRGVRLSRRGHPLGGNGESLTRSP